MGQEPESVDSDTNDIRNPDRQDLDFSGLSGGNIQPYQENYQVQTPTPGPPVGTTWGAGSATSYNTLPYQLTNQLYEQPHVAQQVQVQAQAQAQPVSKHECDRLIEEIMACSVCRQKLQRLMARWNHQHIKAEPEPEQGGGNPLPFMDLPSNLVTNIIIGIAMIFLLDKIFKLKLA